MKIRIKGNSVRIRLTKPEVEKLEKQEYLEETTLFAENKFTYALQSSNTLKELSATFTGGKITMLVPASLIKDWHTNTIVGFNATMKLTATDSLYLLLEKDFICIDENTEDQRDNYENPKKLC